MSGKRSPERKSDSASDLGPLLSLETVVASEHLNWKPAFLSDVPPEACQPQAPSGGTSMNRDERAFLEHVACTPGKPSSLYPKMVKIGVSKALKIRRRLVDLGYLREETINTSSRGRSSIVLFPTEMGIQTLDALQAKGR